jgi:hypothetical protein
LFPFSATHRPDLRWRWVHPPFISQPPPFHLPGIPQPDTQNNAISRWGNSVLHVPDAQRVARS